MSATILVENSMIVCSDSYESQHDDDGHQETCEVSYISSPHGVSNNSSSSSCSSSSGDEDEQGRSTCRKITKQHKQSPSKKKKRSLIGEIVMNTAQPSQLTLQQQAIVFENFEGRKSSTAANAVSQIPGTFSFSHKVENSQLSNNEQTSPKSNMCEVILSNWKSRSDTRQWIKKCIGPQDKKKKVKNNHQWFQSSNTPISNSPQSNNQAKFDRKPSSNSISTTNVWSDSYIHTTCLIPGQRKMSKSVAATTSLTSPMQASQQSISTQTVCYQSSSAIVTQQQQYPQQQLYSNQQQYEAVSSMVVSHNPWLNMNSTTSNVLSDVSDKQFALPSFREFVSTLGL